MSKRRIAGFLITLATWVTASGADLINTLDATTNLIGLGLNNFRVAQSFRTTATDTIVTDVTLKMFTDATTGNFRISIYDATGPDAQPGSLVADFFDGGVTELPGGIYQNFHLGGLSVALNPLSKYYVVADASPLNADDVFVYWQYTTSPPPGSNGETSEFWQSFDGSSWVDQYVGEPQLMRVVAVPEPGTYVLAGLGVIALGVLGRGRSRRKAA